MLNEDKTIQIRLIREDETFPPKISEFLESNLKGFVGRKNYIRKIKNLCENKTPLVIVHGEPGIGKTILLAKITEEMKVPFIAIGRSNFPKKTEEIVKELVEQLNHYFGISIAQDFSSSNIHKALDMYTEKMNTSVVLIFDGIDESEEPERVLERIRGLLSKKWTIIISCRSGSMESEIDDFKLDIGKTYNIEKIVINPQDDENLEDIRQFIKNNISDEKVQNTIFEISHGIFLIADLFVESYKTGKSTIDDLPQFRNIPKDLYKYNYEKLISFYEDKYHVKLWDMLEKLSFLFEPSNFIMLQELTGVDDETLEKQIEAARPILRSYFDADEVEHYYIYQETLKDTILWRCGYQKYGINYNKVAKKIHEEIIEKLRESNEEIVKKYADKYLFDHMYEESEYEAIVNEIDENLNGIIYGRFAWKKLSVGIKALKAISLNKNDLLNSENLKSAFKFALNKSKVPNPELNESVNSLRKKAKHKLDELQKQILSH